MKRSVVLMIACLLSVSLAACSGVAPDTTQGAGNNPEGSVVSEEPEEKEAAKPSDDEDAESEEASPSISATVGEAVEVETKYGAVTVTVDGFEDSQEMRDEFAKYDKVDDGMRVGLLLLVVKNDSCEMNEYGTLFLDGDVYVEDSDGITINAMSGAYDYGQYEAAPGYAFDCEVGQTKRVAVPFQIPEGTSEVTVVLGDTRVPVSVTQGK